MASGAAARRIRGALQLLPPQSCSAPSCALGLATGGSRVPGLLQAGFSNPHPPRFLSSPASIHRSPISRVVPSPDPQSSLGIVQRVLAKAIQPTRRQYGAPLWTTARQFSATAHLRRQNAPSKTETVIKETNKSGQKDENEQQDTQQEDDSQEHGFKQSDRAKKAAQVNMSARLSKDGKSSGKGGWAEIVRLVTIARPEVKWLSISFVFLLISSAVTMSIPFSVGRILDIATSSKDETTLFGLTLNQFFMGFAAFMTLGACANFGRVVLLRIVGERVVSRLRSQLFRRTYVQDAEFFDANRVGDLISRLGSDTVIVGKSITQNISDGLRAIVSGATGFAAMAWLSPKLTSVILLMFPPIAIGAFFYGRFIRNISRQIQKNLGTLTKIAEERLGNIKTSQAFAGEIQEVSRYNKQVRKIFELGRKESIIAATFFGSTGWAGNMTILALLVVGGNLVRSGAMTMGDLTSFMMYTVFAGSSLFGVSGFYSELMKGVGAASRLFELQDRHPSIPATVGKKVISAQGPIRFTNVSFAYPTRPAVSIFNNLDFEIPSGSNVCIVGPSGGGKSTVASLLLRFYNPTQGTITINGVNINDMNVKSLRRRIGMVAQEPVLFSGTVAENIAYGRPNAARSDIIAAAKKANCGFIGDFPEGLETQVGARGAQLSGGQKQRIAIARALLKDPDILILDEATSALDAESETLVNSALAKLLEGRSTTISIAHRLSTIKRSDRLIVLSSEGTVAEIGSYTELSADPHSAFSKLMEWQMSGGELPPAQRLSPHVTQVEEIEDDLEHDDIEQAADEAKEDTVKIKE
ncbi:P-loop containing nucleoside triphosphate hydrolase protein [Coniella lustricola]|uniref:P-loop containing nucleoside triphosphate hydrolase protein n=1 Tax=Coniella lustricola TaxID=2025994 RepID=A0A2T3AL81_9PEZI|nr:P-loop containing nucleoside triphosphate hydrolase protein [Coniella lustricola]